jgi:hypothetical protein
MNYLWVLWFSLLLSSCGRGVKFHPDWYVGDHENEYIINEEGKTIMPHQREFNDFACMHKEKVKELKKLLIKQCR